MPIFADDFGVSFETELAVHQFMESNIHRPQTMIDDTIITRLQLQKEIEALKEKLLFMKKNHEEEYKRLESQFASSGLAVETDTPQISRLSKTMADIWAQYEELARKNHEELKKY
ncbi:keratin, type I cytoskeletal 18-like [Mesocricetus auratus]|uniref:Keratin, type I cytoskeletal 18-like n=1 Tax=Mesocricetus auratus TaxID=10036 RepID=A0ABM2WDX4_MESAU|nr:keratin, type I cytoskeletal 18-like [Mesocricetus auratus]